MAKYVKRNLVMLLALLVLLWAYRMGAPIILPALGGIFWFRDFSAQCCSGKWVAKVDNREVVIRKPIGFRLFFSAITTALVCGTVWAADLPPTPASHPGDYVGLCVCGGALAFMFSVGMGAQEMRFDLQRKMVHCVGGWGPIFWSRTWSTDEILWLSVDSHQPFHFLRVTWSRWSKRHGMYPSCVRFSSKAEGSAVVTYLGEQLSLPVSVPQTGSQTPVRIVSTR